MLFRLVVILGLCLAGSTGAVAETAGTDVRLRVFKVFDGDSLLLRGRGQSYRVQLAGIDAPELGQPWGERSRQLLEKMIGGQRVSVAFPDQDGAGVRVRFREYDISTEMVAAGAAWALPDAPAELQATQARAREAGKGLWAPGELTPVPPWQWLGQQ